MQTDGCHRKTITNNHRCTLHPDLNSLFQHSRTLSPSKILRRWKCIHGESPMVCVQRRAFCTPCLLSPFDIRTAHITQASIQTVIAFLLAVNTLKVKELLCMSFCSSVVPSLPEVLSYSRILLAEMSFNFLHIHIWLYINSTAQAPLKKRERKTDLFLSC